MLKDFIVKMVQQTNAAGNIPSRRFFIQILTTPVRLNAKLNEQLAATNAWGCRRGQWTAKWRGGVVGALYPE